jgi:hypothetical protein
MHLMSSKPSSRIAGPVLVFAFLMVASAALVLVPAVLGILMMEWERVCRGFWKALKCVRLHGSIG